MLKQIKKLNNKGFSLVELIIAFSMLSILTFAVIGVMSAGTNMFTRIDEDINLQYKSQNAMSQFQQYFMGCSKAICRTDDDNVTYFGSADKVFALKQADGKLYFKEVSYSEASSLTPDDINYPFCADVESFTVAIGANKDRATSVRVTLNLQDESGKSYSSSQVFSLRNKPLYIAEPDPEVENSTIYSTLLAELIN